MCHGSPRVSSLDRISTRAVVSVLYTVGEIFSASPTLSSPLLGGSERPLMQWSYGPNSLNAEQDLDPFNRFLYSAGA